MMRLGANGSAANLNSTKRNMANKGTAKQRGTIEIVAFQESLLPRSRPRRSAKTAHMSTIAPRKSTRRSLARQSECSVFGSLSAKVTAMKAIKHNGACPMNALAFF